MHIQLIVFFWGGRTLDAKDSTSARLSTPPVQTHVCLLVSDGTSNFLCDAGFGKLGLFEPVDLEKLNQGGEDTILYYIIPIYIVCLFVFLLLLYHIIQYYIVLYIILSYYG